MSYFSVEHRNPDMQDFERKLHEAIPEHFNQFLDGEPLTFYEKISDHIHLHLYVWAPSPQRDTWTVVTAGMSAHRMNVPNDLSDYAHAELVMTLPPDWPSIDEIQQLPPEKSTTYFWPFDEISDLTRIPYLNDTWLGRGHTVRTPQGVDDTYADSAFSGMLVEGLSSLPPEAMSFELDDTTVHCYGLYPLYSQELRDILKYQFSGHEWFHRCVAAGFSEGIFPDRPVLM